MTIDDAVTLQLQQRAYRMLTDNRRHDAQAVSWAHRILGLAMPDDPEYERERGRPLFTPRELSLAYTAKGAL